MAADHTSTKPKVAPEDEDLFDFPVVEMKLEGEAEPKAAVPSAATPAAGAQSTATGNAAAILSTKPEAPKSVVTQPVKESASASTTSPAPVTSPAEPASIPQQRAFRWSWVALGAVAAIQLVGLLFIWNSNRSMQSSMDQLRTIAAQAQTAAANAASTAAAASPAPAQAHSGQNAEPLAPMESFDTTALRLAREEIRTGNPAAARKRLAQLLAVIDRVDPQARGGVESEALYLNAQACEAVLQQRQGGQQ